MTTPDTPKGKRMKITIEINAAELIEELEEAVPNPTGGKETEESIAEYIDQYDDEIRDAVTELILRKLIDYHTH